MSLLTCTSTPSDTTPRDRVRAPLPSGRCVCWHDAAQECAEYRGTPEGRRCKRLKPHRERERETRSCVVQLGKGMNWRVRVGTKPRSCRRLARGVHMAGAQERERRRLEVADGRSKSAAVPGLERTCRWRPRRANPSPILDGGLDVSLVGRVLVRFAHVLLALLSAAGPARGLTSAGPAPGVRLLRISTQFFGVTRAAGWPAAHM